MALEKFGTYKMKIRWLKGWRTVFIKMILFENEPDMQPIILGSLQDGFGGVIGVLRKDIHEYKQLEDDDALPEMQKGDEPANQEDRGGRPEGPQGKILPEMPQPVLYDRNLFG